MPYDASSIRILRADEIKRFDWHWAEELAHEHTLPLDWVKRGFEASRSANSQMKCNKVNPWSYIDKITVMTP